MKIHSNHRFNYLFGEFSKLGSLNQNGPPKMTVMVGDQYDVVWDMSDGRGNCPHPDYCGAIYRYLSQYQKSYDGNGKPYIWCQVNYSEEKAENLHGLVGDTKGHLVTCYPFSLYSVHSDLNSNKKKMRANLTNQEPITFMGALGRNYNKSAKPYSGATKFKYPISHHQAEHYLGLKDSPKENYEAKDPSREEQMKILSNFGIQVRDLGMVSVSRYKIELPKCKMLFQPNGVGLRHSILEAMTIGKASLLFSDHPFFPRNMKHLHWIWDGKSKSFNPNSEEICDFFDHHMTPQAIVQDVMRKSKDLLG